jgi:hypothetical protein
MMVEIPRIQLLNEREMGNVDGVGRGIRLGNLGGSDRATEQPRTSHRPQASTTKDDCIAFVLAPLLLGFRACYLDLFTRHSNMHLPYEVGASLTSAKQGAFGWIMEALT